MSTRRDFLCAAAAAALPSKPNIVLFYADDLDADELNCFRDTKLMPSYTALKKMGGPAGRGYSDPMLTPHIDSLARDGAVFSRFYISSPVCTPSRYSLLAGRHATRSPGFLRNFPVGSPAFVAWNTPLGAEETNLAKSLKQLGYATGMVGKWHNFDRDSGVNEIERSYAEDADPREPSMRDTLRKRHERARQVLMECGFDFADRVNIGNTEQVRPTAIRGQNLEWHTEGALEFLKQYHDRPFFLYYPLPVPHGQYFSMRRLNPLATTAGMLDKAPEVQPSRENVYERLKAAGIEERNAMATWMDDTVGVILEALETYGAAKNTIVLFISDNPSRGKNTCYESARVPAIMRWPGRVKPGSIMNSLCANFDVAATLIEAAGGTPPADMLLDGRSFLPQLLGKREPKDWRQHLLIQIHNSRGVVTRRWKYIANRVPPKLAEQMRAEAAAGGERTAFWNGIKQNRFNADVDFPAYWDADQLYDLDADLYERRNINNPAVLADMKKRLAAALAPLPHTFGEFKP
jgi:arylsulfatase A-like enzyme